MRRAFIPLAVLIASTSPAFAEGGVGAFQSSVWQGAPTMDGDVFSGCEMTAFFKGDGTQPLRLRFIHDRRGEESIALYSEQFNFKMTNVRAGVAFDGGKAETVQGDVISPKELVFNLADTGLLNAHVQAKKLTLVFSDASIDFDLGAFSPAVNALRMCATDNLAAIAATTAAATAVAGPAPSPSAAPAPSISSAPAAPEPFIAPAVLERFLTKTLLPLFGVLAALLIVPAALLYALFGIRQIAARRRWRAAEGGSSWRNAERTKSVRQEPVFHPAPTQHVLEPVPEAEPLPPANNPVNVHHIQRL